MSASNGVIRIGRKGIVKFAFGDDGKPFDVDIVIAYQEWYALDEQFRIEDGMPHEGEVPPERLVEYHQAAIQFAQKMSGNITIDPQTGVEIPSATISGAEAMHFIAQIREQYSEMVHFFRPRLRGEQGSPATSEPALQFSAEEN